MENVHGIEQFVAEFIEWYKPFLQEIKIELEKAQEGFITSRIIILNNHLFLYSEGSSYFIDNSKFTHIEKGTLDAFVKREEELKNKLTQLADEHKINPTPYFKLLNGLVYKGLNIPVPQYNLFLYALEFSAGAEMQQKIVTQLHSEDSKGYYDPCYILTGGISLSFKPIPFVPGIKMPELYNDNWRGFDHPKGFEEGHLVFNISDELDGKFYYKNEKPLFGFYIIPYFDEGRMDEEKMKGYLLGSGITIKYKDLLNGALTSFLEMLVKRDCKK